jgi:AcrR family transcriptional regulator
VDDDAAAPQASRSPSGGRGARARILAAARALFRDPGINATGVAELAAAAHVSKRTLYAHFRSKDDLVRATMLELSGDADAGPGAVLGREGLSPRARLIELFATLDDGRAPLRGDPFGAAAYELADVRHPARRVVAAHEQRLIEQLGDLARAAGARDPERVGRRLALLYAGAAAQMVALDSAEPIGDAMAVASRILVDAID